MLCCFWEGQVDGKEGEGDRVDAIGQEKEALEGRVPLGWWRSGCSGDIILTHRKLLSVLYLHQNAVVRFPEAHPQVGHSGAVLSMTDNETALVTELPRKPRAHEKVAAGPMVPHRARNAQTCPATTFLGTSDVAYDVVEKSLV
jgi:hypothetical protein